MTDRIYMEGEVRFSTYGAWRLLNKLRENRWIHRRGYLVDAETGKIVSRDDDPHYSNRKRQLTIPRTFYPVKFLELILTFMKTGWLIYEADQDILVLRMNDNISEIRYKDLWKYLTDNNIEYVLRGFRYLEDEIIKARECAFELCKLKLVKSKFNTLTDQVYQELLEKIEINGLI